MNHRGAPRIFISAGEPSGDLHGAAVVRALHQRYPGATIEALGGPQMEQAGATIRYPMEGLAAFGVVEIITKIRAHYRLLRALQGDFRVGRYDLAVLVDYPGFHLRVAEAAHNTGTKVLYYIAPQLWAWRPERARRLAAAVDRLAVVLPFERDFFGRLGLRSEYVGHPLVDRNPGPTRDQARAQLGISAQSRVLGIYPGSRTQEIRRLWKPFRDAAHRLLREGSCDRVLVAGTAHGAYPDPGPIEVLREKTSTLFAAADAALAKSGTTTLEAALAGTPMVVAYKVHQLSWAVFQRVRTVRWVSLVNLVADREIVPEVLQARASASELAAQLRPLLNPGDPRTIAQRQGLALVRERLGQPGASTRVAAMAGELLDPCD
ncbi:MAG TPA: lipid-A-disaccharide synthase [Gemmatimonadales bacterium]|jgi:lipid-A-disaccharide synthase